MKKVPFTPFQLVLTVVNMAALMFCMGCDCFVLIVGMTAGRTKPYVVDLVLSLLAMAVFILLVFSAGRINIFSDKADPDGDLGRIFVSCFLIYQECWVLCLRERWGLSGLKKLL